MVYMYIKRHKKKVFICIRLGVLALGIFLYIFLLFVHERIKFLRMIKWELSFASILRINFL